MHLMRKNSVHTRILSFSIRCQFIKIEIRKNLQSKTFLANIKQKFEISESFNFFRVHISTKHDKLKKTLKQFIY